MLRRTTSHDVMRRDTGTGLAPQREPRIRPRGLAREGTDQFCGNPRLMPPWLGSSQREVMAFSRVKKCIACVP